MIKCQQKYCWRLDIAETLRVSSNVVEIIPNHEQRMC